MATPEEVRNAILQALHHRAPNGVQEDILFRTLGAFQREDIERELQQLVEQEILVSKSHRMRYDRPLAQYSLPDYEGIPIRRTIRIGNAEINRVFDKDVLSAEDMNDAFESLAEYANSLETKFLDFVKAELKSYWANQITLFGIFIALFSFIIVSVRVASEAPSTSTWVILLNHSVQLLPLAIVLLGFLAMLKWLFGK